MFVDDIGRALDQLAARLDGPLWFRFVLQPLMAAVLAVRAGVRDARDGQPPYLWRVISTRAARRALLRNGWHDVTTVFVIAVVLDAVYQIIVLRNFYLLQTLIVASALALAPYAVIRGSVTRAIEIWHRHGRNWNGRKGIDMRSNSKLNRPSAILIAAMTASTGAMACGEVATVAPAPVEVYVADVVVQDVPEHLELVGQTAGFQDVEIRARVEGFLESVNFREGSFVQAGALLYQIDRKPLEAILAAARAEQATAEARLAKANNDVARYTPLVVKQAVSQQELDDARAEQDAGRSQVDAAEAAVEKATLDLGYVRVTSPIAGLVGTTQVKPGNLVGRGESTLLTTVSQIDPIIFRVGLTEADYLRIVRRDPTRAGQEPRADGVELTLADGTRHSHTGRLGPVERAVDPSTGTLGVQFIFPNPDHVLRPGQFGRAKVLLQTRPGLLLVQQRAVQELQNLTSVAVVDGSGKVTFRSVKVGPRVGTLWVIEEGLKPGERVVVEGLQRIQDGITVTPKPAPVKPDQALQQSGVDVR